MKFDVQSLLKDKNVLYVTLFIAITNMFAYLIFRQFDAIIFFIIISIIVSYFSKNMIIIMLAAILSTNLAISIKMIGKVKEGFEEAKKKDGDNMKGGSNMKGGDNMKKDKKQKEGKKEDKMKQRMEETQLKGSKTDGSIMEMTGPKGVTNFKGKKGKDGFTQQLNPARINGADDTDDYESQPSVDYASTLETAYDNLDKLLSSDAINNMSEDTHRLAEKQQMLMGNINKLQPMMEKAGSLLEGLKMGDMNDMLGKLQGSLSKLGPSKT